MLENFIEIRKNYVLAWRGKKMSERKLGKVINWTDKGYGFIKEFGTGNTYFCHISQVHDDEMIKGSTVEFELRNNKKTPEKVVAANVYVCEVPDL